MEKRTLQLIGAAGCLGAVDHRCDFGPDAVRKSGIDKLLASNGLNVLWKKILRPESGNSISSNNAHQIQKSIEALCRQLSEQVLEVINDADLFAVFGGDHSCAIGTWSGAAKALVQKGELGLLWIDAHLDSHLPETSPSGALHGMPLACLLGQGITELCNIGKPAPALLPTNVCILGVRSYEKAESMLLKQLGVRVYFMDEINDRGFVTVFKEAYETIKAKSVGFGISIDLDAIDPVDAPGVGTPVQNGVLGQDLHNALAGVASDRQFVGIEITELNPFRDVNKKTTDLVGNLVTSLMQ